MPYVDVSGIKINFPYEPYPCQVSYMEKVIESLRTSKNGILESPTGTGKTLCLLCAGLAWLENKKAQIANNRWKNNAGNSSHLNNQEANRVINNNINIEEACRQDLEKMLDGAAGTWNGEFGAPKIIYASRTHSQLNQAVHEFKRTSYSYMKAVVIGSREQMCIHPTIMKETNNTSKVYMCRAKVSSRSCHFYNQVEAFKPQCANQVFDIEDLLTSGHKNSFCPYYLAKELKKEADVIFMPYNYVLDPKSRKAHGVELQGNILIFDEAHNLERICEESASFDLSSADIASAISDVNRIINKVQEWQSNDIDSSYDPDPSTISDYNINEVADYKKILLNLEEKLDSFIVGDDGMTLNGCVIFEILNEAGLTFDKKSIFYELTEKMISTLTVDLKSSIFTNNETGLSKLSDVLKIVYSKEPSENMNFNQHIDKVAKHFKVHIKNSIIKKTEKSDAWSLKSGQSAISGRILSYWCFSPGYTMADLKDHGVRVILLTSGTLSPLESFVSDFGIDFPVQLENPHVIDSNQVWIGCVEKGPDNAILSSTYEMRFKKEYLISIGNTIVNFNRIVPMGLLIFFPSYVVMEKCIDAWQRNAAIYKRLEATKKIFIEPKDKSKFSTTMQEYYDSFKDPKNAGAIFMAVCRGKVSEGLDFSDNYGRGVVITGLPYPPKKDARVMLKMLFLDESRKANRMAISGQEWYKQQAWRAVNQALGRVIRHRNDFGAIMLCDIRFRAVQDQLPIWLRSVVKRYTSFGLIVKNLLSFFKLHESEINKIKKANVQQKGNEGTYCETVYTKLYSSPIFSEYVKDIGIELNKLPKASTVNNHYFSDSVGDDKLIQNVYEIEADEDNATVAEQINIHQTLSKTSKNLIRALDVMEKNDSESQSLLSTATKKISNRNIFKTTTECKIIEMDNGYSLINTFNEANVKVQEKSDSNNLVCANKFLNDVKLLMGEDVYNQFRSLIFAYKKNSNVNLLVEKLQNLFSDPSHFHLLEGLCKYIKENQRVTFINLCKESIGQSFVDYCDRLEKGYLSVKEEPEKKKIRLGEEHVSRPTQQTSMTDFLLRSTSVSKKTPAASTSVLSKTFETVQRSDVKASATLLSVSSKLTKNQKEETQIHLDNVS